MNIDQKKFIGLTWETGVTLTHSTIGGLLVPMFTWLLTGLAHPALLAVQTEWWIQCGITHSSVVTVWRSRTVRDFTSISTPPWETSAHMSGCIADTMTGAVCPNSRASWDITQGTPPPRVTLTRPTYNGPVLWTFWVTVDAGPPLMTVTNLGLSRGDFSIHTGLFTGRSKVGQVTPA